MTIQNWTRMGWTALALTAMLASVNCSKGTPETQVAQEEPAADAPADKEAQIEELKKQVDQLEKEVAGEKGGTSTKRSSPRGTGAPSNTSGGGTTTTASNERPSSPSQPSAPPPPQPRTFTLKEGTRLVVRTTTEISTKTAVSGDTFAANLEEPLEQDGFVIAPKGARVNGLVAASDQGGRVKGRAQLELQVESFRDKDGNTVRVNTANVEMNADKNTKKDALKVGIATGIGAAIGAIAGGGKGAAIGAGAGAGAGTGAVLLTRGQAAVLPSESIVTFLLTSPVTVTEKP